MKTEPTIILGQEGLDMASHRWRFVWVSLLCLLAITAFAGSRLVDAEIFSLPLLTISIVTVLFLLSRAITRIAPDRDPHLQNPKLLDAGIFLLLAFTIILGRVASSGVNDWYYPVLIGTAVLIAFRIVSPPIYTPIHLAQIILLAFVTRATPWFSYPVYGQDRFHQTAVGHIVTTGSIVPESITYYANFPAAHIFAATYTNITGVELKVGYFSLGIIVAVSLLGVYLLARSVLTDERSALVATLFVSVAGYHVKAGAEPFAQALFTALIPFILYLLFRRDRIARERVVLVILVVIATTIQNIAPLVLLGICAVVIGSGWIFDYVPVVRRVGNSKGKYSFPLVVPALVGVVGIYYYVVADYLIFQTMRILWLLEPLLGQSDPAGQSTIEDTGVTGIPTVELFGHGLPDVLMWAAPVLTVAGILILAGYQLLDKFIVKEIIHESVQYVSIASMTYAAFAIAFVMGGPASRSLPSITVLTAPVVGWVILYSNTDRWIVGKGMAIIVILCVVTAGILTPPVAKAELDEDNFRAWMTAEEAATVEFSMEYADEVHSSSYFAGYESHLRGMQGSTEHRTLEASLDRSDPESIDIFTEMGREGTTEIHSSYFRLAYGIEPPDTNKIYTTGEVKIYT
ncbi:hypothetical protein [Haloprofundus salilacus]|uniref:hypothetical protein n=1 Tax=Haloprofundus salilacus TaxID=2876190 RepID=UPI001CCF2671|nr:hypothetical protein [Haloprofundus salilacus]